MVNDIAIQVDGLSKFYKLYDKPADRLKETFSLRKYHREFYALRDISIDIKRGETVAILGKNGSGKSTLLKLITGVVAPSFGSIHINGKIAALLELGAGFNPEFTGIENVYMSGTIMGYTKEQIDAKLDDILSFADIGDFVYQPVKMYSSGMFARLAFAVNSNVNPDILIVDEALAVGDMFFQAKCIDKMKRMMDDGVTVLFVSHDTAAVKSLCQRGILLNKGNLVLDNTVEKVVEEYFNLKVQGEQTVLETLEMKQDEEIAMQENSCFGDNALFQRNAKYNRIQNGKAEFYNVQLLDSQGREITQIDYGQEVVLRMAVIARQDIKTLGFGYHIRSATGVDIVYSDTQLEKKALYNIKKNEKYTVEWKFKACLQEGVYNMACVMSIPIDLTISRVDFCDFVPCAVQFSVVAKEDKKLYGYVHWQNNVCISKYDV